MFRNTVKADTALSFNSANLVAGWNWVGLSDHPLFLLRIVNASDKTVEVSYDGVHLHDAIPAGQSLNVYTQANAYPNAKVALFAKDTKIWLSGTAGTGNIYIAGYFVDTL